MSAVELPLAIRIAAARASTTPWLRAVATPGRWYPAMPQYLPEEESDKTGLLYEERLCDPQHGPYDHARGRECAKGFHARCSGQGCECPHHDDAGREWAGAPEPLNKFAKVRWLPRATAARVLAVAQEGLKTQWINDLDSLRSLLSSEYQGALIPRDFAVDVACALYDSAELQGDADSSKAWERIADVDWQAADDADRRYVDGGPFEPVDGDGLPPSIWSGDPVVPRVEAALSSDVAHVRVAATPGRWYPVPVPALPEEFDDNGHLCSADFQARMTHPTHSPYDHVRSIDCALGGHATCSMSGCECPHHVEPTPDVDQLWTGPQQQVVERFAATWTLPHATVVRVLNLANEMMWGQFRPDEVPDEAPGLADLEALCDTISDVYEATVTHRFAHSVAKAMLESALVREDTRGIEAWSPLVKVDYEDLDELDERLARLLGTTWAEPHIGMGADVMGAGRVLRPVLLDYLDGHRALGQRGGPPWVVASLLLFAVALVPVGWLGWSWQPVTVSGLLMVAGLSLSMMNMFCAGERSALNRWRTSIIRAGLPEMVVDDPQPPFLYPSRMAEMQSRE